MSQRNDVKRPLKMASFALMLSLLLSPCAAVAKCGTGQPATYDDVDWVIISQTGCGSTLTPGTPDTLACSRFWTDFSVSSATEYSQFNLEKAKGTYQLSASLVDARKILERDDFYRLSPPGEPGLTDQTTATASVRRCGVATAVTLWASTSDPATMKLFDDFRALIGNSRKKMTDENPHIVNNIFDPWGGSPPSGDGQR